MAQNITLLGASYPDVPSVELPKTGGGTASFTDITDTTVTASTQVLTGYGCYDANGNWINGSATGGGTEAGTVTQDENGYLVFDDDPPTHVIAEPLSVSQNGTYTAPTGKAYTPVTVSVSGSATLIAKSITANGTYNASSDSADGYSQVTVNVSSGGSGSMHDPIRFFDYDGTLVASYSSVPSALPSVPTHSGLASGTWNYTLTQVTAQFNDVGTCDVGANYTTSDGSTRIYCNFEEGRTSPVLGICPNGTVVIDWGDNTATNTLTGTSLTTVQTAQHNYATAGSYTITLTVTNGSFAFSGTQLSAYILRKSDTDSSYAHRVYSAAITKIEIGDNAIISDNAFNYCPNLESISMPAGCATSIGSRAFNYCRSLNHLSIPSGVTYIDGYGIGYCTSLESVSMPVGMTSIGSSSGYYAMTGCYALESLSIPIGVTNLYRYAFRECESLRSIKIPTSLESIDESAFYGCVGLASVTLPSNVTLIGAYAFQNCYGMKEYHIMPATPPSSGTTAFQNIQPDCIIYVPAASLDAYKTANKWSTYASYMVGE